MSTFTTGMLIDNLKVGQIAKSEDRIKDERVVRTSAGFYWCDKRGEPFERFYVNDVVSSLTWRIFPKTVSIEEAMFEYKCGRIIRMTVKGKFGKVFGKHYSGDNLMQCLTVMTMDDVADAEWSVDYE